MMTILFSGLLWDGLRQDDSCGDVETLEMPPERGTGFACKGNSMLTYVPVRESRLDIFQNSYDSLIDKGVVVGVVHHQIGKPLKTWYFKIRNVFSFILKEKVGNKSTGFKGYKLPGYYYDKKWLMQDLSQVGFNNILIYSLDEFFKKTGKKYDKTKGYNQLIFVGSK